MQARKRYWVGCKGDRREVVRMAGWPTPATGYTYMIGPFRTRRGAEWMADPIKGRNNPHCQCVADAERLAKQHTV